MNAIVRGRQYSSLRLAFRRGRLPSSFPGAARYRSRSPPADCQHSPIVPEPGENARWNLPPNRESFVVGKILGKFPREEPGSGRDVMEQDEAVLHPR